MGKRSGQRKKSITVDSDDDSVSTSSTSASDVTQIQESEELYVGNPLEGFLEALYEKRGSTREKALEALVGAFASQVQFQFAESNCITLQHQLVNSIKRGSTTEACYASHALGLLGITVGCGDSAHEILEESVPLLSQALRPGTDARKKTSVVKCLAALTFVGGFDAEDTQRSMQLIWQLIHPKPGSNVGVASKPPASVVAAAVSAWSFLLTTIDGQRMNFEEWQESISYLSVLLDKDDRAVRIAAGEAMALIIEIGNLELFSKELKTLDDNLEVDGKTSGGAITSLSALKGKILQQVKALSVEAAGKGLAKKDLSSQRNLFRDILEFLESGYGPEMTVKLQHGDTLRITTWTQYIQWNFLKQMLGSGFAKHMQENELFHEIFNRVPKNQPDRNEKSTQGPKRLYKSPNSAASKARTQLLNKQRALAQGRNTGHLTVVDDDA